MNKYRLYEEQLKLVAKKKGCSIEEALINIIENNKKGSYYRFVVSSLEAAIIYKILLKKYNADILEVEGNIVRFII